MAYGLSTGIIDIHPAVWRFLTAAVFHMGALHVGFNMLAFVPIGGSACADGALADAFCQHAEGAACRPFLLTA